MLDAFQFVEHFGNKSKQQNIIKFAKVSPNYISGRPTLVFDGETTESIKNYPYLSRYIPQPNDRVMVIRGVIMDSII